MTFTRIGTHPNNTKWRDTYVWLQSTGCSQHATKSLQVVRVVTAEAVRPAREPQAAQQVAEPAAGGVADGTIAGGGEEESGGAPQDGQPQGTQPREQADAIGNSQTDGERREASGPGQ